MRVHATVASVFTVKGERGHPNRSKRNTTLGHGSTSFFYSAANRALFCVRSMLSPSVQYRLHFLKCKLRLLTYFVHIAFMTVFLDAVNLGHTCPICSWRAGPRISSRNGYFGEYSPRALNARLDATVLPTRKSYATLFHSTLSRRNKSKNYPKIIFSSNVRSHANKNCNLCAHLTGISFSYESALHLLVDAPVLPTEERGTEPVSPLASILFSNFAA